ncbi:MAG: Lrp/AsnC family transcriptional regulator [Desulfurococcaceae archaeon]|jgi:Lrp/AsnC family transcriptional regulator for asnA, asnC and gidA
MARKSKLVDEVDLKIINELIKNARATYRELSKVVGLTDVAVMKRVRKLERAGVIKRYTAIVDPQSLGYSKVSFTGLNVSPEKLFDVVKVLKEKEYVKYLALTSGDHDLLAVVWARSDEELEAIHDEIKRIDGVRDVYPLILTGKVKEEAYI